MDRVAWHHAAVLLGYLAVVHALTFCALLASTRRKEAR
jgi:hypothetical protein